MSVFMSISFTLFESPFCPQEKSQSQHVSLYAIKYLRLDLQNCDAKAHKVS